MEEERCPPLSRILGAGADTELARVLNSMLWGSKARSRALTGTRVPGESCRRGPSRVLRAE